MGLKKWTILVNGDMKKTVKGYCPSLPFWNKRGDYIVRSISVYPALRQVVMYVTKAPKGGR